MENYLENIVIPYYQAQVNSNLRFILLSLDFKILITSTSILKGYGCQSEVEMNGKSYEALGINEKMVPKLKDIAETVIRTKKSITYLTLGGQRNPTNDSYYILLTNLLEPILDNKQNVVALLARRITNLIRNYFNLLFPYSQANLISQLQNNKVTLKDLSSREYEIIYLLANGFSQYKIADTLGITRSTVLRTITDRIIPKLDFFDNNTSELIKTIILLNIHSKIPKSLVEEQVIILDEN